MEDRLALDVVFSKIIELVSSHAPAVLFETNLRDEQLVSISPLRLGTALAESLGGSR